MSLSILEQLVLKFPDEFNLLSDLSYCGNNPNISFEFILAHPEINWQRFIANPNISFESILAHPELPWDWINLSKNPNISMNDILSHPELNWDWRIIGIGSNITLDDADAHPDKPWNWETLSKNPNLTVEFIENHKDKPWNFMYMTDNPNIPIEFSINNALSNKVGVATTLNQWYWVNNKFIPRLSIEVILTYPNIPWFSNWIFAGSNNAESIVGQCKNIQDWFNMSNDPKLMLEFIINKRSLYQNDYFCCINCDGRNYYQTKIRFDWSFISSHYYITCDTILTHPELPWDYSGFSSNPNLTLEFILSNPDKPWDWIRISENLFDKHPYLINKKREDYIKKYVIYSTILEFKVLPDEINQKICDEACR